MVEQSLHESLKRWYSRPGDLLEVEVKGYVVDIVRGDRLIEIQTGNFSAIKKKLYDLIKLHPVRLVHPVSQLKWIVRVDGNGSGATSRRRSPKRGRVEDLFEELVYIPEILMRPSFQLEVLLVHSEEVLINNGLGGWRRRGWSIHDRRLLQVVDKALFTSPSDMLPLLPTTLSDRFTTADLASASGLRRSTSQRMTYCLRRMGLLKSVGRKRREVLYSISR